MKKYLWILFLLIVVFGLSGKAKAFAVVFEISPKAQAEVGQKVTINFTVSDIPSNTSQTNLYFFTNATDPLNSQTILKQSYNPFINEPSHTYSYTWDTEAAGSSPGIFDIGVGEVDSTGQLLAIDTTRYTLNAGPSIAENSTTTSNPTNNSTTSPSSSTPSTATPSSSGESSTAVAGFEIKNLGKVEFLPTKVGSAQELITTIINWMLSLFGVLAVIALIYSGIMYITSGGDTAKIETAKKNIVWAIIGIVFVLLAVVIVSLINNILGG